MLRPKLYKYLDKNGALATLENQTFKWTKPSDFKAKFKDDMDMTISRLFPEDDIKSLESIQNNVVHTLANNANQHLTYSDPRLDLIQQYFLKNPDVANIVHDTLRQDDISEIYDIDRIRKISEETVNEINEFLQGYRVLCVSDTVLSERMWNDYAEDGKGISLRIEPSPFPQKDYVLKLFKAVQYFDKRPTLFEGVQDFLSGSFFEDKQAFLSRIIDRIIYSELLPKNRTSV